MKVVKAKYYDASGELIPLDPQPQRVRGEWVYERTGTDEIGDWKIIDVISEESVYIGYDAEKPTTDRGDLNIITEDEWNKPVTQDIESMDLTDLNNVEDVTVLTLQEYNTINTEMNHPTSSTVTERLVSIIVQLFSNVYNAISSIFRR